MPQVCVVFSDGKSSAPGRLSVSAKRIDELTNITVIAIGVGTMSSRKELDTIATGTLGDNIIITRGFETIKKNVAKSIVKYTCEGNIKRFCFLVSFA